MANKTDTLGELFRRGDYYLVKRVREIIGDSKSENREVEVGYNIILYDATNSITKKYDVDQTGLITALGDASSGDRVWIPNATITLTIAIMVPAGVHLQGCGEVSTTLTANANIQNLVTLGAGSILSDMTVNFTSTSASESKAVFLQESIVRNLKIIKAENGAGTPNWGIEGDLYSSSTQILTSAENITVLVTESSGNGTNHRAINFDIEDASPGVIVKNITGKVTITNVNQDGYGIYLDGEAANEIYAYDIYGSCTSAAASSSVYGIQAGYCHIWNAQGVATCGGLYACGISIWNSYLYNSRGEATLTASGSDDAVGIDSDDCTLTNCIGQGTGGGGTPTIYGIDTNDTVYLYSCVADGATADIVGGGAGDNTYIGPGTTYDTTLDTNSTISLLPGSGGTVGENLTVSGKFIATPDAITATSEGVAASLATVNTEVTTNGDSDLDNVTLANGTSGQIKHIYCVVEGNAADTWKITPATMCGGTQITFAGVGEGCTLVYADSEGWVVAANNGGTIA